MPVDENDPVAKPYVSAFTQALAGLGWTDGRNVRIDLRWAGGDVNRIRALAQELVGMQPDIIMANGTAATVALQRETRTIPIVFASGGDPVASGVVPRLDRPGGNTKLNYDLLRDIAPVASIIRVPGIMVINPAFPPKTVRLKCGHKSRYGGQVRIEHDGGSLEVGSDPRRYDPRPMHDRPCIPHDEEAATRLAPKRDYRRFDFYVAMNGRSD
jgi:hypothetical protein